jgi:hypothetical protein
MGAVTLIAAYILLQTHASELNPRLCEGSVLKEVEPELVAALFESPARCES